MRLGNTALVVAPALAATGALADGINRKPQFVGTVSHIEYDGDRDDLLTAGLGRSGLASAVPPAFAADAITMVGTTLRIPD